MGLASSQARLLSITARLTDNEYKSQQISNAKMRLANITSDARAEYNDALNSNIFVYNSFDSMGNSYSAEFTPNLIYQYEPNKTQYSLLTSGNKILVTNEDAANFQNTSCLAEFLDAYGVLDQVELGLVKTHMVSNPAYVAAEEEHEAWIKEGEDIDEKILVKPGSSYFVHNSEIYNEIIKVSSCMSGAIGNSNCFFHVLADLVGVGEHTTSDGHTFTVRSISSGCGHDGDTDPDVHHEAIDTSWCWNTSHSDTPIEITIDGVTKTVAEHLKDLKPQCLHNDHVSDTSTIIYGSGPTTVATSTSCDCEKYTNCYQKVVDMMWNFREDYDIGSSTGGSANPEHLAEFFHFIEYDLDIADEVIVDPVYEDNPAYIEWKNREPVNNNPELIQEVLTDSTSMIVVSDPEKAQWYTNLWYKMNGNIDPQKIQLQEVDTFDKDKNIDIYSTYYVLTQDETTSKNLEYSNYKVLDSRLASSPSWLEDALSQGIISLSTIQYDKNEPQKLKWEYIIYSNARDLSLEDNREAVAKAEAKYNNAVQTLEFRDRKYQEKLNKLDSEHHVLQTEYESIKNAMNKNIERSYKSFQG